MMAPPFFRKARSTNFLYGGMAKLNVDLKTFGE